MKLKTWHFYKATNLIDIEGKNTIEGEFILLNLRPDIQKPNRLLTFGISLEGAAQIMADLQNKELTHDAIFKMMGEKIGFVEIDSVSDAVISTNNFSEKPLRDDNIKKIIEMYNIFIKSESIEFDTEDYSTEEKLRSSEDIFTKMDIKSMSIAQLLNTLTAGMNEYYGKTNELSNPSISADERIQKTLNLSTLQSNLILFFDQTVRKMDELIVKQEKELKELKKNK
ncbi:hypothetical protein [Mesoplasma photuris]|uniref:hypothetical protein n=1 Tax=Mesoplasma photuris TaxID=217731 RepID=UPI0004E25F37|nr:hypothetical protein [Mesoplasma photuris]